MSETYVKGAVKLFSKTIAYKSGFPRPTEIEQGFGDSLFTQALLREVTTQKIAWKRGLAPEVYTKEVCKPKAGVEIYAKLQLTEGAAASWKTS